MISNKIIIIIASLLSLTGGVIFFLLQQDMLIVSFVGPRRAQKFAFPKSEPFQKKKTLLSCWKEGRWQEYEVTVLWREEDLAESLKYLINSWISYVQDEQLIDYALGLKHVLFSPHYNEVYVSFSRSPLHQEWSITDKLLFIEGLLKTIRKTTTVPQFVSFLLHDSPLPDDHLDFSHPWPIEGFSQDRF